MTPAHVVLKSHNGPEHHAMARQVMVCVGVHAEWTLVVCEVEVLSYHRPCYCPFGFIMNWVHFLFVHVVSPCALVHEGAVLPSIAMLSCDYKATHQGE